MLSSSINLSLSECPSSLSRLQWELYSDVEHASLYCRGMGSLLPQDMLERDTPFDILSNLGRECWVWRGQEIGVVVVVLKFHVNVCARLRKESSLFVIVSGFEDSVNNIHDSYLSISRSLSR